MKLRPKTPLIRVSNTNTNPPNHIQTPSTPSSIEIKTSSTNKDYLLKNFQTFMKNIINDQNQEFLSGSKNVIKYILSQYLQIPEDELPSIKKLSILITNDYGLLNQFGTYLPNLILLKLNNSNLLSFNDLGTNFKSIQCLQLNNCHLKDLNGLVCMQQLQVLDIENNNIDDLIDIEMCSALRKLNLKKNQISKYENIEFISYTEQLEYVCLVDNPIINEGNNDDNIKRTLSAIEKVVLYDEDGIEDIVKEFDEKNISIEDNNKKPRNTSNNTSNDDAIPEMIIANKTDVSSLTSTKTNERLPKEIEDVISSNNYEDNKHDINTNIKDVKSNQKPNIVNLMRSNPFKTTKIQIDASSTFHNRNGNSNSNNVLVQELFNKTAKVPFKMYLKGNNNMHNNCEHESKLCRKSSDSNLNTIKIRKVSSLKPVGLLSNNNNQKESNINSNRDTKLKDKPILLLGDKGNTHNKNNSNSNAINIINQHSFNKSNFMQQQTGNKKTRLILGTPKQNN